MLLARATTTPLPAAAVDLLKGASRGRGVVLFKHVAQERLSRLQETGRDAGTCK